MLMCWTSAVAAVCLCATLRAAEACMDERQVLSRLSTTDTFSLPDDGEAVQVAVGVRLQRMHLVAESSSLHIDGFLTREWTDPRLSFQDSDPCREAVNGNQLKMWLPHLTPINDDALRFHSDTKVSVVHSDGTVLHSERLEGRMPCLTDALSYPFGNTTCTLILRNEHQAGHLLMRWDDTITRRPFATEAPIEQVGDLKVLHVSFLNRTVAQSNGDFDELIMEVHLARMNNKTLLLFYLPSVIFVMISWLSLVMGPMVITRAVINMGALLLLVVHYSSNMADLPRTTGITAIDIWKIGTLVFVLAVLLELVVVTCMASVGRSRRLHRCCRGLPKKRGHYHVEPLYEELNDLRQRKTRVTCSCCRYSALVVDLASLVSFALAFVFFSLLLAANAADLVAFLNDFSLHHLADD